MQKQDAMRHTRQLHRQIELTSLRQLKRELYLAAVRYAEIRGRWHLALRDERIEIRGFGSFVSKHYRARTGRNPRTGESIPVPAKRLPIFKVGKELRERVDYDRDENDKPVMPATPEATGASP